MTRIILVLALSLLATLPGAAHSQELAAIAEMQRLLLNANLEQVVATDPMAYDRANAVLAGVRLGTSTLLRGASVTVLGPRAYGAAVERWDEAGFERHFVLLPLAVNGAALALPETRVSGWFTGDEGVMITGGTPAPTGSLPLNYPNARLAALAQPDTELGRRIASRSEETIALFARVGAIVRSGDVHCSLLVVEQAVALTAAHCACLAGNGTVRIGTDTRDVSVIHTSAISRWSIFGGAERCSACSNGVCGDDFYAQPDIAFAYFEQPWTIDIAPVRVATPKQVANAQSIFWVGFGEIGAGVPTLARLSVTEDVASVACDGPPLPERRCLAGLETYTLTLDRGPCKGDSGAPGMITLSDGGEALALLASRDAAIMDPCGRGGIGTLLGAPSVLAFLRDHIDIDEGSEALFAMMEVATDGGGLSGAVQ